jgi:hypothetical protein
MLLQCPQLQSRNQYVSNKKNENTTFTGYAYRKTGVNRTVLFRDCRALMRWQSINSVMYAHFLRESSHDA